MKPKDSSLSPPGQKRRKLIATLGIASATGVLSPTLSQADPRPRSKANGVLDVVIIGAGLSGLTAARDLHNAGCGSFVVLEARDRVGGRTLNHDLGNGVVSEGGGEWIGPGQTAVANLARELNVDTFPTYYQGKTTYLAGDAVVRAEVANGGGESNPALVEKLNALARDVPSEAPWTAPNAAELDKLSVGDWLLRQGVSAEDKIGFDSFTTLSFGGTPATLGLLQYLAGVNSARCSVEQLEAVKGGAQETRFVGGSQILSIRMAAALGEKVTLSSPVRRIVGWDRDIVEVHTDHGVLRARQVIAALNPGLCHRIVFDPPLPEGRAGFQRHWPTHAPMRKLAHVYSRPFWRDQGLNGQIVQVDGPVMWSFDNSPPDGSIGVLGAFVKPASLPHDAKQADQAITAIYARAFGEAALQPLQFHDMDWGKADPWSLTCIAPIPPGFWTKWGPSMSPPAGRMIWSGTETADIWAGAMDGAVRSGHHAALQALAALARG